MNEQIREYLKKYPEDVAALFSVLRQMIFDSADAAPEETFWAKLPSYYIGEAFVRLIPFKDHINIEAAAILPHGDELSGYKLTPKGMLQLRLSDAVPEDVLKKIFRETLAQK